MLYGHNIKQNNAILLEISYSLQISQLPKKKKD